MTDTQTPTTPVATYCYAHPSRETSLKCRRCERLICAACARPTPTGYLCIDCVNQHKKVFNTAVWSDYLIVFLISAGLSALADIATIFITSIVWGFFIIGLAPLAGTAIGNLSRRFIKNRRATSLNYLLVAGMVIGALPVMLISGLPAFFALVMGGQSILHSVFAFGPILWQIVYLVIATPVAYSQFSGLVFRR